MSLIEKTEFPFFEFPIFRYSPIWEGALRSNIYSISTPLEEEYYIAAGILVGVLALLKEKS